MRIGVIGGGKIGGTVARLAAQTGHEVAIANSRGPESVEPLAAEIAHGARAATVEEAAHFGVLILLAIPFSALDELPADALAGRIVVDAMNYYPNRDRNIPELDSDELTSSELTRGTSTAPVLSSRSTRCGGRISVREASRMPTSTSGWRCTSPATTRTPR